MKNELYWRNAESDDLPPIDEEVIALVDDYGYGADHICYAHRPDPYGFTAKSIIDGGVCHYEPKTYGKGGWNIENVKWWMPCPPIPTGE